MTGPDRPKIQEPGGDLSPPGGPHPEVPRPVEPRGPFLRGAGCPGVYHGTTLSSWHPPGGARRTGGTMVHPPVTTGYPYTPVFPVFPVFPCIPAVRRAPRGPLSPEGHWPGGWPHPLANGPLGSTGRSRPAVEPRGPLARGVGPPPLANGPLGSMASRVLGTHGTHGTHGIHGTHGNIREYTGIHGIHGNIREHTGTHGIHGNTRICHFWPKEV